MNSAGVASLLHATPSLFMVIKYTGAAYLGWLGLGLLRGALERWRRTPGDEALAPPSGEQRPFRTAFLISLTNPKAILFFVSFFIQFVDPQAAQPAVAFLILGVILQILSVLYLSALQTIPHDLYEAATIDGAGYFRILLNVIVPSIKSAMIVVAMFLFIQIWNDLLQQMIYINTEDKFTISMGLSQLKGSLKTDWSAIMCGTCMSFVPGVVFYLLGQRYFVEGIVMTGMKN
jgi:ABC-type glycerol-3-phosphate transport system permease component